MPGVYWIRSGIVITVQIDELYNSEIFEILGKIITVYNINKRYGEQNSIGACSDVL